MSAFFMLLLPVLGLGLLVVLGAVWEWLRPLDCQPLRIDPFFARNDEYFARRFRVIAADWWAGNDEARVHGEASFPAEHNEKNTLFCESLRAEPGSVFESEIWCRQDLQLAGNCRARAVLSDESATLGEFCHIERWAHAERALTLARGSCVAARTTCAGLLTMTSGCKTRLLSARELRWQGERRPEAFSPPPNSARWKLLAAAPASRAPDGTLFVDGNVVIDENAHIDVPLVVRGSLLVRRGAVLARDVKAHDDAILEGVELIGNLTALGSLRVGDGSRVRGCLRGDREVWIGDGVNIGEASAAVAVVGGRVVLTGSGSCSGRIKALKDWVEVA